MDDPVLVGVLECLAELNPQRHDLAPGHRAFLGEHFVEGGPGDVLHRVVERPARLTPRHVADDVGVAELLEDRRLAEESLEGFPLAHLLGRDHLDRRRLVLNLVMTEVNDPHRPRPQLRLDPEGTEFLADHERHPGISGEDG